MLRIVLGVCAVLSSVGLSGQGIRSQINPESLGGLLGQISLSTDPGRRETTIVVRAKDDPDATRRIAFVVQTAEADASPWEWEGSGQVLISDRVVAVRGADGFRRVYGFSAAAIPPQLQNEVARPGWAVGIARYELRGPSVDAQVATLKRFGVCDPARVNSDLILPVGGCGDCSSGGEGALQCSHGKCSVVCNSGYFACCKSGSCKCCKVSGSEQ